MAISKINTGEIKRKAESNTPLSNPTPESKAIYQAHQNYVRDEIAKKAAVGASLSSPNAYKNQLYAETLGTTNGNPMIQDIITQSKMNSNKNLTSMQDWLSKATQAQMGSATAQLGLARDNALAQLEMNLQKAINQGQLSIKEAEAQFAQAKDQIDQQAYRDAELTNLTSHDRGIQNSAQMVGLMQGDQFRRQGLISDAVTARDQQINAINNQLEQMKYETGVNKGMAQSQYDYGIAQAQADLLAKQYGTMGEMQMSEFQRLAGETNNFNQARLAQQYQLEQMAKQQGYTQDNMKLDQKFSLEKLSVQQRYTLEQMAKSFGYDLQKMSVDQQYKLAQMAQGFGYDMALQENSQGFQADMQERGFAHDLSMLREKSTMDQESYRVELERQLKYYTDKDVSTMTENDLRQFQQADAELQSQKQNAVNLSNAIKNQKLATLLESYPKTPGKDATAKDWANYESKINSLNKQIETLTGSKEFSYQVDKAVASGAITKQEGNTLANSLKTLVKSMPTLSNGLKYAYQKGVDLYDSMFGGKP